MKDVETNDRMFTCFELGMDVLGLAIRILWEIYSSDNRFLSLLVNTAVSMITMVPQWRTTTKLVTSCKQSGSEETIRLLISRRMLMTRFSWSAICPGTAGQ